MKTAIGQTNATAAKTSRSRKRSVVSVRVPILSIKNNGRRENGRDSERIHCQLKIIEPNCKQSAQQKGNSQRDERPPQYQV